MEPSSRFELDVLLLKAPGETAHAGIADPPVVVQVLLSVLETSDLSSLHLFLQVLPGFVGHAASATMCRSQA